jgi:site-specific DNA recombinase
MRTATQESIGTKRAVGYFRVSTNRQAGERNVSLETQRDRFARYCQSNNLVAVSTFTDTDSGLKDNRREYQGMLRFLQEKGADVVVVQYLDRFGRQPKEILRRIWALQELGITVQATDEDLKEELVLLVRAGLAGAESKRNSERVRANMARVISRGVHAARAPFGYQGVRRIYPDGRARVAQFIQNPMEVEIIKAMFHMVTDENMGHKSIADRLNRSGYRSRSGKPFVNSTVQFILNNPALKGTLIYGRRPRCGIEIEKPVVVDGFYPAILGDDEWERLSQCLALRRNGHAKGRTFVSFYLLSGLARCGHCGGPMIGKTANVRKYSYRRYYCSNAQRSREGCNYYNGHSAGPLERAVLGTLDGYADRESALAALAQMNREQSNSRHDELQGVDAGVKACESNFDLHLNLLRSGHISEAQFALANEPVRQKYDNLLRRQKELKELVESKNRRQVWQEGLADTLTTFAEDFKLLSPTQQKGKLMEIIQEVRVYRDRNLEIMFRESPP